MTELFLQLFASKSIEYYKHLRRTLAQHEYIHRFHHRNVQKCKGRNVIKSGFLAIWFSQLRYFETFIRVEWQVLTIDGGKLFDKEHFIDVTSSDKIYFNYCKQRPKTVEPNVNATSVVFARSLLPQNLANMLAIQGQPANRK